MVPINYVDPPDIPEGLTIREWRARQRAARDGQRAARERRRRRRWLRDPR